MTTQDILRLRLANQGLTMSRFKSGRDAVSWLGAVQSQDYSGALWALGQRVPGTTYESIEDEFNHGTILRTHVMRPTWHFVTPSDIRWILALTAPRVNAISAYYYRSFGLDDAMFKKTHQIIARALEGQKQLTRDELKAALTEAGVLKNGLALAYIIIRAELDGLICSGPRRGKQFTYMLLEERVPKTRPWGRDESLAELTTRYFTSHGPALITDFVWWSGLTAADAKRGIELSGHGLTSQELDGKTYWYGSLSSAPIPDAAYLLPNYDEYMIAYKYRDLFFDPADTKNLDTRGNMLFQHMLIYKGHIIGAWRRTVKKDTVVIETQFFGTPSPDAHRAYREGAERYAHFLSKKIEYAI